MACLTFICIALLICVTSPSLTLASLQSCNQDTEQDVSCPTWMLCSSDSHQCRCGSRHHDIIRCDSTTQTSSILDCYCVTYDTDKNETVAGACYANCGKSNPTRDPIYTVLPRNVTAVNNAMCGWLSRTGPLCGHCLLDHFPLVYSFNLTCVKCPNGHNNWWKYILVGFGPLTLFYFVVLFFKINAHSPHLHSLICISQICSMPAIMRVLLVAISNYPKGLVIVKVLGTLHGIWNLDFFRTLLPEICLKISTLQMLALDYAVALYPLVLIIVSCIMIEMHDNNFKVIVFLWKPFRFILLLFKRNWDVRTSVIDVYATFFLLSFVKLLSVSSDLLLPANTYSLNTNKTKVVVYYDGSIEYFGKQHRPYAILASIVLLVFVIAPISILLLYPFRCFQRTLTLLPVRWYHVLRTFVDSFQGYYKDGTREGTCDCRCFAVFLFLYQMSFFLIYFFLSSVTYFPVAGVITNVVLVVLVQVQPYKPHLSHYAKRNSCSVLLILLLLVSLMGVNLAAVKDHRSIKCFEAIAIIMVILPLFYMLYIVVRWLISRRKWGREIVQRFNVWRQGYEWWSVDEDRLPYRLNSE